MANLITSLRIFCALGLIICPTFSAWFYVLYIIGGVSDVLDGIVARSLGKETKFGAQLDTIADIVFIVIAVTKSVSTVYVPIWLIVWIILIAVIKFINIVSGFVIYERFITEHTVMNKICGVLLFLIPLCIGQLSQPIVKVLIIITCCVATFAAIQEGYYVRIGKEIS